MTKDATPPLTTRCDVMIMDWYWRHGGQEMVLDIPLGLGLLLGWPADFGHGHEAGFGVWPGSKRVWSLFFSFRFVRTIGALILYTFEFRVESRLRRVG